MPRRALALIGVATAILATAALRPAATVHAQAAQPRRAPVPAGTARASVQPPRDPAAVLQQYCVTCHNSRTKSGGLELNPAGVADVSTAAASWEKVVRKLRTMTMPPAGMPRPDEATYAAVARQLESKLDRNAAAHPDLGAVPLAHRLTRTEYRNAIRDLLAVDALPKEMSVDLLLPPDNISSGFDNIADLLFVSPTNLERYLDAARKISRLAVGDPTLPVMVNIHRLDAEQPQDDRLEDLPYGTRGGISIRNDFPVDATYVIKVELAAAGRDEHQLEISIDGERVQLESIGGRGAARGRGAGAGGRGQGRATGAGDADDPAAAARGPAAQAGAGGRGAGRGGGGTGDPEFRLPLKAGTHVVGVTFVQHTDARDEATLRPRTRSRGTLPAVERITISGPYDVTGPGNSASRRRIFSCTPATAASEVGSASATATARSRRSSSEIEASEVGCARRILSTLARRAYRRPATDLDVQELMPFYTAGRSEGGFDRGIQRALERLLVSSQFLFRIERVPPGMATGHSYRVSDIELASRLSFFIWSSIPDDELLTVAAAGHLSEPQTLERQVRRMLADPRADSLVTNFAEQWLYLRDIDAKQPDEVLFQDFDENLRQAMRRETDLFVTSVFRENRSVIELLTANYTFLNERLAKHYGLPYVRGSDFRRVDLPAGSVRGGLLGQGSILTITSYATRTSPVLRGKWVLENLLASPPPPPPPDVPALKTAGASAGTTFTMREAMTKHRANPACASCHARMDPIGFAMEHFDAVGRWRDTDGGQAIDASGVFPEGTTFDGVAGLKRELVRKPEPFVASVAERLLMYALGRNLQYYDAPAVRGMLRESAAQKYTLSSLVMAAVRTQPFQMRQAGAE